ncbi:hypothetical protein KYC5002_12415 [Archangium violaceum]|uniref:hypothetical protein n=1 Tax=Archangium violaceum TaxID=83451 RepID=UPI002B2F1453|nr:hypothetical protein KYC5002_12415 [Archangium gephyra]
MMHVSQLIPSPNGRYQAVVLDGPENASGGSRLLKVVRAGEPLDHETRSVQEALLTPGVHPRITWLSNDELLIDQPEVPTRPEMPGEVSLVFAPWRPVPLPPDVRRPPKKPSVESVCCFPGLTLPTNFAVLAGGAHGGKESTNHIDQSGHPATTMSVSVDHPQKPVVLMLGAYEPTIWTIHRAPGTTILAVLASGFHRQVVTGLDDITPVAIHTYDNKSPCGTFLVSEHRLRELVSMAQKFFGRGVDRIYPAHDGVVIMGGSQGTSSPWLGRGNAPAESYFVKPTPNPAALVEVNLDEAIRKGQLRRANLGDKNQWEAEMVKRAPMLGLSPDEVKLRFLRANSAGSLDRAYVVLEPMTFPAGLCGSRSAVFFVPKGTERPRGDPGHSTIYDFNDMSCTGTGCG